MRSCGRPLARERNAALRITVEDGNQAPQQLVAGPVLDMSATVVAYCRSAYLIFFNTRRLPFSFTSKPVAAPFSTMNVTVVSASSA